MADERMCAGLAQAWGLVTQDLRRLVVWWSVTEQNYATLSQGYYYDEVVAVYGLAVTS